MGIQPQLTNNYIEDNTATIYGDDAVTYCIIGEYLADDGTCKECGAGVYTLTKNAASCLPCKSNTQCMGGYKIIVDNGYWRDSIYSDEIVSCSNQKSNCDGGFYAGDSSCAEGHIGALCESCDLFKKYWPDSYSHSSKYGCASCSKISNNILKIFL